MQIVQASHCESHCVQSASGYVLDVRAPGQCLRRGLSRQLHTVPTRPGVAALAHAPAWPQRGGKLPASLNTALNSYLNNYVPVSASNLGDCRARPRTRPWQCLADRLMPRPPLGSLAAGGAVASVLLSRSHCVACAACSQNNQPPLRANLEANVMYAATCGLVCVHVGWMWDGRRGAFLKTRIVP